MNRKRLPPWRRRRGDHAPAGGVGRWCHGYRRDDGSPEVAFDVPLPRSRAAPQIGRARRTGVPKPAKAGERRRHRRTARVRRQPAPAGRCSAQSGIGSRRYYGSRCRGRSHHGEQPARARRLRISFGDRIARRTKTGACRSRRPIAYGITGRRGRHVDDPQQRPTVFRRLPRGSRASGNRSACWTSTPKACCCSPIPANWPTS